MGPVRDAGRPAGAVSKPKDAISEVFGQYQLAFERVHEIALVLVPLASPRAERKRGRRPWR